MLRTRTEQVIDVSDWDQLVMDTYGRHYSFQQQDGCKERQRVYIKEEPIRLRQTNAEKNLGWKELGCLFVLVK